jgi:hypothetical protein
MITMTKKQTPDAAPDAAPDATPDANPDATPGLAATAPDSATEVVTAAPAELVGETPAGPAAPAPEAQGGTADANLPDATPDANPDLAANPPEPTEGLRIIQTRVFPGTFMVHGGRARRNAWAPGFELVAEARQSRTGGRARILITGSRAGLIPWNPPDMADHLLADDWEVHITPSQLEAVERALGAQDPAEAEAE